MTGKICQLFRKKSTQKRVDYILAIFLLFCKRELNGMSENDSRLGDTQDLKHVTVVFSYHNVEKFADEFARIKSRFVDPTENENLPWTVTAMSTDHEIFRLELIEQALDNGRSEYIGEILAHPNIGSLDGLNALVAEDE
jgi:hypothetical protein